MKTKELIPSLHDFLNSSKHARSYNSIKRISKKKLSDGCIERCFFSPVCVYLDVITDPQDNFILHIKVSDRSLQVDPHHLLYFYAETGNLEALKIMDIASREFRLDDKSIPIKAAYSYAVSGGKFDLAEAIANNSEYLDSIEKIYQNGLPVWILGSMWQVDAERIKEMLSFMKSSLEFNPEKRIVNIFANDQESSLVELIADPSFFDGKTRKFVIKATQEVFG